MPRSKSKKSSRKSRSSKPLRKFQKALMDYNSCMDKTVKQIRKSSAYKDLVPFGTYKNPKSYHFGKRSYMKKTELCEALSDPKKYHAEIKKNYGTGKRTGANKITNSGPRKRFSRLGNCTPSKRKQPCKAPFRHKGITTTAKPCCYKKPQSAKTQAKRRANASAKKAQKRRYNRQKTITQGKSSRRRRKK